MWGVTTANMEMKSMPSDAMACVSQLFVLAAVDLLEDCQHWVHCSVAQEEGYTPCSDHSSHRRWASSSWCSWWSWCSGSGVKHTEQLCYRPSTDSCTWEFSESRAEVRWNHWKEKAGKLMDKSSRGRIKRKTPTGNESKGNKQRWKKRTDGCFDLGKRFHAVSIWAVLTQRTSGCDTSCVFTLDSV